MIKLRKLICPNTNFNKIKEFNQKRMNKFMLIQSYQIILFFQMNHPKNNKIKTK